MDAAATLGDVAWAPAACTLPTSAQPLRVAEFDRLFAQHVTSVRRDSAGAVTLTLTGGPPAAATAAELAARETDCCGFFTFDLRLTDGSVELAITTSEAHAEVLAALADRAAGLAGTAQ